jgi:hypothetical protein
MNIKAALDRTSSKSSHGPDDILGTGPRSLPIRSIRFSAKNVAVLLYEISLWGYDLLYFGATFDPK